MWTQNRLLGKKQMANMLFALIICDMCKDKTGASQAGYFGLSGGFHPFYFDLAAILAAKRVSVAVRGREPKQENKKDHKRTKRKGVIALAALLPGPRILAATVSRTVLVRRNETGKAAAALKVNRPPSISLKG